MNTETFRAFVQHASGGPDTPNDYLATKIAVMKMFPKLAFAPGKNPGCMHGGGRVRPPEEKLTGFTTNEVEHEEGKPRRFALVPQYGASKLAVSSKWVSQHAARGVKQRMKNPTTIGFNLLDKAKKHLSDARDVPLRSNAAKRRVLGTTIEDTVHGIVKKAMGLDSHAALAQSLYHNNGANAVARMAVANPAHKSGLLQGVKNIAPALGGVRTPGTNPLRAAASGMIHAKLASFVHPAADLAGLGMLGVPVAKTLRDPHATAKERSHAKWEAAGLGTLGAVSGHNLWQSVRKPVAQVAAHI